MEQPAGSLDADQVFQLDARVFKLNFHIVWLVKNPECR